MQGRSSKPKSDLRKLAEEIAAGRQAASGAALDPIEMESIIHELHVHQIELELQNEELRRAQAELEDAKSKYLTLYNNAPIGYLVLNESGIMKNSNHTFMEMVQAEVDQILLKPFADLVTSVDRDIFRARYRSFFNNPEGKSIEVKLTRQDDSTFFARLGGKHERLSLVGKEGESRPTLLLLIEDISEQRFTAIESRKQAIFMQSLLAAIPSPVFYKDINGRYLGCNEAFEHLTGKTQNEIIGKTVHDLWPEAYSSVYNTRDMELIASPGRQQYEHIVVDADGIFRDAVFYKSTFTDDQGQTAGIVGVLLDVTERKRAEEDLRKKSETETLMAKLAENLLSANPLEETTQLTLKAALELTNSPYGFTGYIDSETGALISPTLSKAIWSECDVPDKSFVFDQFSGLWGWVLQNGHPLLTNSPEADPRSNGVPEGHIPIKKFMAAPVIVEKRVAGIIALCNAESDYTEEHMLIVQRLASLFGLAIQRMRTEKNLRRAKDQAESANTAKSNFLATMSHEIRTPMNAVIGFTNMTLESDLSDGQRENLEIVSASAQHLMSLLNDILDLSKIEADRLEIDSRPFELDAVLFEAISSLSIAAKEKGLDLNLDISPVLRRQVFGDRQRLHQVLINLISNAIKFTEKGYVSVTANLQKETRRDTIVHFLVNDTGIGIPIEKQSDIFEPFTQVDSTSTRRYGGTGLGLAICRRLVESMGGNIWVESELGQGSSFHFTVIFKHTKSEQDFDQCQKPILPSSSVGTRDIPARILLAEDNLINQKLISKLLAKESYSVEIAMNGAEAVELCGRHQFDLILMDVEMPEMNGIDATKAIRRLEANSGRRTPIIALTAHAMKGDKERFVEAGMDDYHPKPIDWSLLIETISRLLSSDSN